MFRFQMTLAYLVSALPLLLGQTSCSSSRGNDSESRANGDGDGSPPGGTGDEESTGGTTTGVGGSSPGTGGEGSGAAASGGGTGRGGNGATATVSLTDYISRKWARWPIPNPPSLGLPNPMSYTETDEGVLDDVTGLVWQETTSMNTTTWMDALSYCENLGPGWTLPTRMELTTIVNHAVAGPKVETAVFSFGGGAGWTWASTPWVVNERRGLTGDAALSWFINFAVGDSHGSLSQTAASAYSRCVRVPASRELPANHYVVTADEVTDQYTGLIWQRWHSGDEPSLSFDEAFSYCEELDLAGRSWRLPTVNEIASIVDDVPSGDVSPATEHDVFPDMAPDAQYWSQSPYGTNDDEHWTLNFEDGFTAHRTNETSGIARCVR